MKKLSFIKGMLPADGLDFAHKRLVMKEAVLEVFTPKEVILPMVQHHGRAAIPVVAVGDSVTCGQMIAREDGNLSAPVHASCSGIVTKIDLIRLPNRIQCKAIWIKNDLRRRVSPNITPRQNPDMMKPDAIRSLLFASGIVGMGGEGYPTYAKCLRAQAFGVRTLVVNVTQSEPFLACDLHIVRTTADKVLFGAAALAGATGAKRIVFCIEDAWNEEIISIQNAIAKIRDQYIDRSFGIKVFRSRFPQGCQQLLMKALFDVEISPDQLPEVACKTVIFNTSTCYAVSEMIERNQPLTSRVVTISGDTMTGHNVVVPIGTTVDELLERVPGAHSAQRVVWGGAMTGVALHDLKVPIIKTTTAISVIRGYEPALTPCIHCGACTHACPVGLEPNYINRFIEMGASEALASESIQACIACGACSYVCPAGIALSTNIAKAAYRIRKRGSI